MGRWKEHFFTWGDEVLLTNKSGHHHRTGFCNFSRVGRLSSDALTWIRHEGKRKPKGINDWPGKVAEAVCTSSCPSTCCLALHHLLQGSTFSNGGRGPDSADVAKPLSSTFPGDHCEAGVGNQQQAGYCHLLLLKKKEKQHLMQR